MKKHTPKKPQTKKLSLTTKPPIMQDFDQIFNSLLNVYEKEFGQRKLNAVFENLNNSNKIRKLLNHYKNTGAPINASIILNYINAIPYFIFSRGQTQAIAALIILKYWHKEMNFGYIILNDSQLLLIVHEILKECQITYF